MIFKPTMYMKSIYDTDFEKIYEMGYRILLIDLDNTLVPHDVKSPTDECARLIADLKALGFRVIILSNNNKERVSLFAEPLEVKYLYSARKPLTFKYKRLIAEESLDMDKILCIGDQVMTDVYGANKLKLANMLVEPLAKKDIIYTKFNRFLEKIVYRRLAKKNALIRGTYYYE